MYQIVKYSDINIKFYDAYKCFFNFQEEKKKKKKGGIKTIVTWEVIRNILIS